LGYADRFFRTLYEVVLKVHLQKAGRMDEYFGLVFRAMKSDKNVSRVVAFIRRLL
jgi:ribosome biogenesis protein MAK21